MTDEERGELVGKMVEAFKEHPQAYPGMYRALDVAEKDFELRLMEIEDWLMTQSKEVIASAPACLFTKRSVLAGQ
jgi:hypothetical protein